MNKAIKNIKIKKNTKKSRKETLRKVRGKQ